MPYWNAQTPMTRTLVQKINGRRKEKNTHTEDKLEKKEKNEKRMTEIPDFKAKMKANLI
jgi:hypothetical protein